MPGYKHKGGYERKIDMINRRFVRLLVVEKAEPFRNEKGKIQCAGWKCLCDCGNEIVVRSNSLRRGLTKSCGCLNKERAPSHVVHNMSKTRIYRIYKAIKQRCCNKKSEDYKYYGGRGITVCDEWRNDFMAFYDWAMANGYTDNLTIDREDNDGNYEPSNCRWVTRKEQAHNKTNTVYTDEHIPIAEIAEKVGIVSPTLARNRYKAGWSVYDATHTPVLRKGVKHEEGKETY